MGMHTIQYTAISPSAESNVLCRKSCIKITKAVAAGMHIIAVSAIDTDRARLAAGVE